MEGYLVKRGRVDYGQVRPIVVANAPVVGNAVTRATFRARTVGDRRSRGIVRKRIRAAASEKKGMDTTVTLQPAISTTTTNASSFVLNLVVNGDGSWNRIGRKLQVNSLRLKGHYVFLQTPTFATGLGASNYIRCVVVWDKQPSGVLPTFDTIFGTTVQSGTEAVISILDPPKYDNMDRFKVIYDKISVMPDLAVSSFGTGPNETSYVPFDEYIKLQPKCGETVYSGQSDPMTIADISSGALYVYYRAQANNAVTTVGVVGTARLRYMN